VLSPGSSLAIQKLPHLVSHDFAAKVGSGGCHNKNRNCDIDDAHPNILSSGRLNNYYYTLFKPPGQLLYRDAFCDIARLIDVVSTGKRHIVGKKL
jgi:hypothetical protein